MIEFGALAIMAPDADIEPVLAELRDSLHEHNQMVRTMAVQAFAPANEFFFRHSEVLIYLQAGLASFCSS